MKMILSGGMLLEILFSARNLLPVNEKKPPGEAVLIERLGQLENCLTEVTGFSRAQIFKYCPFSVAVVGALLQEL